MMKKFLRPLIVVLLFFSLSISHAQSNLSHELGVMFGISSLQTDFGQRNDFPSANLSSMSYGVTHYLKFFGSQYNWRSGTSYFSEHFKLKTEFFISNNNSLEHKGKYVKGSGPDADKLRAMTGSTKMYNIGTNLEYYFLAIEDYSSYYSNAGTLNPFISAGIQYTMYDPDIQVNGTSLEGQLEPYTDLIDKWQSGAVHLDQGSTFGVTGAAGLRYSLEHLDLVVEGRYHHFFADEIDGLNAPNDPANKKNDSMVMFNLGVVYVFGRY